MTKDERKYLGRVAELGCAVCRRMGYEGTPSEIHHKKGGMGIGQRSKHDQVLPLCVEHHRGKTGVHGMGIKAFVKHYGFTEEDLINEVHELLGMGGGRV